MRRAMLAVLLLSSVAIGAPPAIEIPAEVRPAGQYVNFVPKTDGVSVTYVGFSGVEPVPSAALADKKMFLLDTYGKPAGRYKFAAVVAGGTGEQSRADFEVVIGTPPAPPVPPTPPDPKPPDPKPPAPDGTSPFDQPGLRVLIVYETAGDLRLTVAQKEIIYGREVRQFLDAKCVRSPDGKYAEYRIWDKDVTPFGVWKPPMTTRPPKSIPWLYVGNGTTGYEGPLPPDPTQFMSLVSKYLPTGG